MTRTFQQRMFGTAVAILIGTLAACGGGGGEGDTVRRDVATQDEEIVAIKSYGSNAIQLWNEVGAQTVNSPAASTGTPEERAPAYDLDMATMNVAMYDALALISKAYKPFMASATDETDRSGYAPEYAAHGAAYTVLTALFPSRSATYRSKYEAAMAGADENGATSAAFGAAVAQQVVAKRANDGRLTPVLAYVPGIGPGQFRGTNPVNQARPYVRPFSMKSADQFRPPGPPSLDSAQYLADFIETRDWGSATSTLRTADQTVNARFNTEAPGIFWTRNVQQFASSRPTLMENARLMALIYVTFSDASTACFEAKYHFNFWRPTSAIRLADTDGNPATNPDAQWAPVVPTPNHPEYPAAHGCNTGAFAEALRLAFGTRQVQFSFDSTVTGTTRAFKTTDELIESVQLARIHGGMHFRTATVDGRRMGEQIAEQLLRENFTPVSP